MLDALGVVKKNVTAVCKRRIDLRKSAESNAELREDLNVRFGKYRVKIVREKHRLSLADCHDNASKRIFLVS